jgi:hypothetical protein
MKTKRKVPVTFRLVETIPAIMEDNVIYVSSKYRMANHKCLGCYKHESVTAITVLVIDGKVINDNDDTRWDDGWNIIIENDKISVTPSILNNLCGCHYVITNGVANIL